MPAGPRRRALVNGPPLARVEIDRAPDGRVRVVVAGEIDLSNAAEIEERLNDSVRAGEVVLLDLRAVEYLDSQGVRVINDLALRREREGFELSVIAPADSVAGEVLRLADLGELLTEP
ncbi:MAG: STAS domain-containing protein [Acidimicrobiales bacterium]